METFHDNRPKKPGDFAQNKVKKNTLASKTYKLTVSYGKLRWTKKYKFAS